MEAFIQSVRSTILTDWNVLRILRLGLGVFVLVQAITYHDGLAGAIAGIFLVQALTNTGCCGVSGCTIPKSDQKVLDKTQMIEFEEIQSKSTGKN